MSGSRGNITKRQRDRLRAALFRLTPRDRYILGLLARHRVLTTDHIQAAAFDSVVAARHRMATLHNLEVVARFRPRPVRGSAPWHYVLDALGARLLAEDECAQRRAARMRRDRQLAIQHSSHLDHLIAVNGFFTALLGEARASQGHAELRRWLNEAASADWVADHLSLEFGYEAWKSSLVRPDGMGTWREDQRVVRFLVEIDTGTEPLTRIREKLARYAVLAEDLGISMPWVLFSFPGPNREKNVRAALRRYGDASTTPMATARRDQASSPAEPIWRPLIDGVARLLRAHLGSTDHRTATRMEFLE